MTKLFEVLRGGSQCNPSIAVQSESICNTHTLTNAPTTVTLAISEPSFDKESPNDIINVQNCPRLK